MRDALKAFIKNFKGEWSEEQERRTEICLACPDKEQRKYAHIVNAKMEEVKGYVCLNCPGEIKCPIATKVFAEDDKNICPKWRQ